MTVEGRGGLPTRLFVGLGTHGRFAQWASILRIFKQLCGRLDAARTFQLIELPNLSARSSPGRFDELLLDDIGLLVTAGQVSGRIQRTAQAAIGFPASHCFESLNALVSEFRKV